MHVQYAVGRGLTDEQLKSEIDGMLREINRLRDEIQEDRVRGERFRARRQATMTEVRAILSDLQRAA